MSRRRSRPEQPTAKDFDLAPVYKEFLKYAPAYAAAEAEAAVRKVMELQSQGLLRNGVYYIVLTDLVGATAMAAELGNEKTSHRIEYFVRSSLDALGEIDLVNIGVFLREIGDAVLLVFSHFPDILRWHAKLLQYLEVLDHTTHTPPPLQIRTVVHVGEVYLNGVNPVALAVSQVFKIEKLAGASDIVLSDPAYQAAWPSLARAYHAFEEAGFVELEGHNGSSGSIG